MNIGFFIVIATFMFACLALTWKPQSFIGEIGRGMVIAMVGFGFYLTVLLRLLG